MLTCIILIYSAIQLLGFLPQDMVGMSIFDFYHPEDFEQLYAIYKQGRYIFILYLPLFPPSLNQTCLGWSNSPALPSNQSGCCY
jgi:hypothetical protein